MAITDNGNGSDLVMPVQPMGYGNNYGGGYGYPMAYPVMPVYGGGGGGYGGGFGGDWGALIILFLFANMFGGGFGGWGMGGFGGGLGFDFPWLLNGQAGINANTNAGFNQAATANTLGTIQTAINTGFSNAEVAACNRAMDAQATAYNNQIADLNRSFAAQTAVDNRLDTLAMSLQQCCCDQRLDAANLTNTVQREAAATRAAGTANTQAVLDKLCQLELDGVRSDLAAERRANTTLQNQLNMAAARADNAAQTAALIQDNNAQTAALINRIAPYPQPSFIVGNPYYSNFGYGWGNNWNNGCGCGNNFGGFNGNF